MKGRLCFVSLLFAACGGNYSPKPLAYPRVEFPEKNYTLFSPGNCPFQFEVPAYSRMDVDQDKNTEPCWYNMQFPVYNATLHISYKPIANLETFDSIYEDTRVLTMKHFERADQIEEIDISNEEQDVYGLIYTLKGNTATNFNFFITDSANHFLRGALYFNTHTKQDSVRPAFDYMVQDVYQMIRTARWK